MLGLLNINKPAGLTSRRIVDAIVRVSGTTRVGHAGTLDPLATGVLLVCIGWATRLVPYLQQQHKKYRGTFLLGQRSDTDDVTGTVVAAAVEPPPSQELIASLLGQFTGRILQVPPQFSAVHVGGRRAHELARQGKPAEIAAREVEVHVLTLVSYDFPLLTLDIECGSGTYVRSIGRDLGNLLGCGAVLESLTRTAVGDFRVADSIALKSLSSATLPTQLLPSCLAVAHLPQVVCDATEELELRKGKSIDGPCRRHESVATIPGDSGDRQDPAPFEAPDALPALKNVAVVDQTGALIAVCEWNPRDDRLQPRLVAPKLA